MGEVTMISRPCRQGRQGVCCFSVLDGWGGHFINDSNKW